MLFRRIRNIVQACCLSGRKPEPATVEKAGKTSLPSPEPRFIPICLSTGLEIFVLNRDYAEVRSEWLGSASLCESDGVRIVEIDKAAVYGLHFRRDVFLGCSGGRPAGVVVPGKVGSA